MRRIILAFLAAALTVNGWADPVLNKVLGAELNAGSAPKQGYFTLGSGLVINPGNVLDTSGGGGGGEANTGSNLGTGEGIYASKTGTALEFKSLVEGTNVTLTSDGDEITINAASGGATDFTDLADVPSAYTGQTLKYLRVNGAETALEFATLDKTAVGLGNVENTALSTWAGSTNITTLGTIATGTWNATALAIGKISATGTPGGTNFLRGDGTWSVPDHTALSNIGTNTHAQIDTHIASTSNPHSVTKSQVGLGSVENTALSTWAGTSNITTLGTITTGTWNGTDVALANVAQVGANTVLANPSTSTADISTVGLSASQLLGRGSTGNVAAITLGTNLSMSGATLNASGASLGDADYGDITVSGSGTVWTIDNGAVTDAKLGSGIDAGRLADASVSNTEFQYLNGVTSAIQTQLDGKVDENAGITGATKTKITYDAKGLVTAGADATTSDIAEGSNLYYTDERNDDRTAALLTAGSNITLTYNDAAGTLTVDAAGGGGGVSDGDKGDVTVSSSGTVWTVDNDAITYAKMQNVSATDRLLGRDTASAGDVEELTVGGGLEFTGSGGIQRSALTGDVTASAGSNTTAIATNAVTNSQIRQSAALSVIGRSANSTGNVADISAASDGNVLRRSGTTIGFGAIALGSSNAVTGTLGVTNGGTGLTAATQGDLLYSSSANTWAVLAKNTSATRYLSNTGTSNNPAWAQIDLTNGVTGALPVANGGTGATSAATARTNLGFKTYISSQQTITAAGSLTLAHGLGAAPNRITYYLVNQTAESNYSIGDAAHPLGLLSASGNRGCTVVPDSTNLNVRFGSDANTFFVHNKTTGASAQITNANWKIVFIAEVVQ